MPEDERHATAFDAEPLGLSPGAQEPIPEEPSWNHILRRAFLSCRAQRGIWAGRFRRAFFTQIPRRNAPRNDTLGSESVSNQNITPQASIEPQKSSQRTNRWLLGILAFALVVRLFGIDWDQSHFFHPDERRIAEAVNQITIIPLQLNPHFYAYGSLPFYVTKSFIVVFGDIDESLSGYSGAILIGRGLSALWGTATVGLLFLLARRLFSPRVGLLASALLAMTVLHVQNSHFATNDVPLTFLILACLWLIVRFIQDGRGHDLSLASLVAGFAIATKVSAVTLVIPLVLAAIVFPRPTRRIRKAFMWTIFTLILMATGFVIGEPYAILDSSAFLHDVLEQSHIVRHAGWVPYTLQYVGTKSVFYELRELVVWGMGLPLGLAALIATVFEAIQTIRQRRLAEGILFTWLLPFFAVTCLFSVRFPRYLLPIYPLLILCAAAMLLSGAPRQKLRKIVTAAVVAVSFLYLLAFMRIYTRPHTMVEASQWFFDHAPAQSKVINSEWEEGFPFYIGERGPGEYQVIAYPFYETDSDEKTKGLANDLATSDWLVFPTKRIYGAIAQVPDQFPLTMKALQQLFSGQLGYTLVKEFSSRPGFGNLQLPTELADESLSVYDHPRVLIFANTARFTAEKLVRAISSAPSISSSPRQSWLRAQPANPSSPEASGIDAPVQATLPAILLLALTLELLGLAAYVLAHASIGPTRGLYSLTKVLGVLVFAIIAWLGTSVGIAFSPLWLFLVLFGLILAAAILFWRNSQIVWPRREIITSEFAFWGAFGAFGFIRALNPEIFWGEKPMDFSFLNILYRTSSLPPPEPWFAGSTLDYTYFGHFTVAALGKLLGIAPEIMFNLGIAMTAGLVAAAFLATGMIVGRSLRAGIATLVLGLGVGNLSGPIILIREKALSFDFFWSTSRIIPDTINEFPFWSMIFADLHAHVLAMPWAISLIGLLVLTWRHTHGVGPWAWTRKRTVLLTVSALTMGALMITNGWSTPTYLALMVALVLACALWRDGLSPWRPWYAHAAMIFGHVAIIVGSALIFTLPFWLNFTPPPMMLGWERGPWARPTDVFTIFGGFLVFLLPIVFCLMRRRRQRMPRGAEQRDLGWLVVAISVGAPLSLIDLAALFELRLAQATSICPFAILITGACLWLALNRQASRRYRLPLSLAAFAFALVAGAEIIYLWDRMNTVFKLYMDAWLILSVGCGVVLADVFTRFRARPQLGLAWRITAGTTLAIGVFTALSGAWGALNPRRCPEAPQMTLDGTAFRATLSAKEWEAIDWLNRNVSGTPTLCEAFGPSYREYARVSMNTGLPIPIGWDYHVFQRGKTWAAIDQRIALVKTIYTSTTRNEVAAALHQLGVSFLYVGDLEFVTYNGANLANFRNWTDLLTPVFDNGKVVIFLVRPNEPRIG